MADAHGGTIVQWLIKIISSVRPSFQQSVAKTVALQQHFGPVSTSTCELKLLISEFRPPDTPVSRREDPLTCGYSYP